MTKTYGLFSAILIAALTAGVYAEKPKPEGRWYRVGKTAHARALAKTGKQRDRFCAAVCRKAGARKPADIGACKEGCFFGSHS